MWVKLCGNTTLKDARLCAEAGSSALGFIFAMHSKRYVSPQAATPICQALVYEFPRVERIGVFTHANALAIADIAERCQLTAVQLQSRQTQAEADLLRNLLPGLRILAAFPWAGAQDFDQRLATVRQAHLFDAFLIDSPSAQETGGTGEAFAWHQAAASVHAAHSIGLPVIAAGGLNAANVGEAIAAMRPWGVDAVSSVESAPGVKSAELVREFIAAARAAQAASL